MTLFWILAGTLSLAVIAAVLLPLWRVPQSRETTLLELNRRVFAERLAELEEDRDAGRIDPDTFADLKTELQRNLLSVDLAESPVRNERLWRTPVALAFLASALSVFFYAVVVFTPDVPQWWQVRASASPAAERLMQGKLPSDSDSQAHSLQEIIQGMQYQLQRNPQQPEGWFTLGVAYAQAEMLPPALVAFERAWRLKPEETRYALTLAQARLFSNQGRLDDFSRKLLATVVQREPSHEGALLLLGLGAWRSGDAATAVPALEQLVKARQEHAANDNSPAMQEVAKALADARAQLSSGPAAASARLVVSVQADKAVVGKFAADDVVYVFARALQGPPMPLAVVRRKASELPLTLELDDANSMMPQRPLSSVQEIVVEARISRHGAPEKRPGDIEAVAVPVRQGAAAQTVTLRLSSIVP
ncbi:MAG: c-type cytochrome biogenesis protein CcmI [Gammaproteobacteria bacterium]